MARSRKPPKSLRSPQHQALCGLLLDTRRKSGLTQVEVAHKLGRPQSYVAKYEGGERRLDVVEFLAVCQALQADPLKVLRALLRRA